MYFTSSTNLAPKIHQTKILEAMTHPAFYPHPVKSIEQRETHISTVFLTGAFAYKIKKPVNLGFLNFSSLEKREYYCRQEVALNRRLSSGIYVGTVPIACHKNQYALSEPGTTVEFAVKMHQLAESDSMQQCLQSATLSDEDIDALVHLLAHYYTNAETDCETNPSRNFAWEKNLKEIEPFVGVWINCHKFSSVRSAASFFYRTNKSYFQRRRQKGMIKDCHGDLRTDHIYFTKNGIQIIDCIEFNSQLRYMDVICDLAFLAMDLEYYHFFETAWTLIRMYVEQTNDIAALPLLNFYRCYRAMVRCKVSCLRLLDTINHSANQDTLQGAVERYLDMALDYAAAFSRPILWVVCGLPASGKSTIAGALATVFDINVIRSDVIRKSLFIDSTGTSAESDFGKGRYSAYATEATYKHMFALAEEYLKKGNSVVIDATFSRAAHRAEALQIAAYQQATPVLVECRAAETILSTRLLKRETEPSVSDARLIHLQAFIKRFESIDRMENEIHILVDTANPPAACLRQILLTEALWNGTIRKGGKHV